jgi:DUF4097 and DUF4098 domain-containing protein YvlB
VDVSNQNGLVDVSGLTAKRGGQCNTFRLETSFSTLRIALPGDAGYNLTARTSFGKISSEFPVTATLTGPTSSDSLSGKIGSGECEVRLTNSNGSIQILRGVAQPPAKRK